MARATSASLIPMELIATRIYLIRRRKVMFDCDLAELYALDTKALRAAIQLQTGKVLEIELIDAIGLAVTMSFSISSWLSLEAMRKNRYSGKK